MAEETILSVGIDVGTSTTSLIFSHLTMENRAGFFSVPCVEITKKEVIYRSPVYRTPLKTASMIDGTALGEIIRREYRCAGVDPRRVGSGAVIITGESARKENAATVLQELSGLAGDFVVATAGPDLESVIAGQGSGAQQYSLTRGVPVVNLDIGGGTTNAVLFDGERVAARGCLDIGGRQITLDGGGRISGVSSGAAEIARSLCIRLNPGQIPAPGSLEWISQTMWALVCQMLGLLPETELLDRVRTRGAQRFVLPAGKKVRHLCFSGGVADCIYHPGKERFAYGDMGVLLADAIRTSPLLGQCRVIPAQETIRATVIGAGSYTTTISGSTVDYSPGLFPRKNVPVLKLTPEEEARAWRGDGQTVEARVRWYLNQSSAPELVLAMEGKRDPDYGELTALAQAIAGGLDRVLEPEAPVMVITRADIAKALGQLLRRQLAGRRRVLSLDGILVSENDFVDFGSPVMNGLVVPVVVKTLVFGGNADLDEPRRGHPGEGW